MLIVHDEPDAIVEHLVYHLGVMGFDAALVYDNGSVDGTAQRIRRGARRYDVVLMDRLHRKTPQFHPQIEADTLAERMAELPAPVI